MQILPSGLVLPPLPYAVALAVATLAVAGWLSVHVTAVTERQVVALAPWMVAGGALHAIHQARLVPDAVDPFFAAPAVYVTTFVLAGAVWAVAAFRARARADPGLVARYLAIGGAVVVLALAAVAYAHAVDTAEETVQYVWPVVGFLGAAVVTAPLYYLLAFRWTAAVDRVGMGGPVVVYAHALDGVSTALGIDVIGTGERTPIPARIMEFAGTLPTEPYLGRGWLFVVVKLLVASAVVLLFADYVDEEPTEGNLLLAVVAAVGMGPAANNLFIFLLGA
jgi:uncharacterized membrane protein